MRRAALLAALLLAGPALASEEDHLPWRSVSVDCFEHAQTGKVSVRAEAGPQGLRSFSIQAFGRSHALGKRELALLSRFPLDSLKVTHEAGYPQTGGHAVHARLRRGEETALISVVQKLGVKVTVDRAALYGHLERECAGKLSPACCSASVEAMRKGGFALAAPDGSCPAGSSPDMMRCKDSFRWCVPKR